MWRHKNEISETMGFVRIFWKNNAQEAYLPKMSISGQIVPEIVAQLRLENCIQTLLNFFWVGPKKIRRVCMEFSEFNRLTSLCPSAGSHRHHTCSTHPCGKLRVSNLGTFHPRVSLHVTLHQWALCEFWVSLKNGAEHTGRTYFGNTR